MKIIDQIIIDKSQLGFMKKALLLSLLIHIIFPIFSTGFHHWDEHYQILEFLGTKLGVVDTSQLTWEYKYKMRSWIQPGFYYIIAKPLIALGIDNPFHLTFVFRFISSLIGFLSILLFNVATFKTIKSFNTAKWTFLLSHFLWFLPYIHSRTSSENLGTSFFLAAISLVLIKNRKSENHAHSLIIGLLFGLAFQFRFQVGILVMFAWLWQLFIDKRAIKGLFLQALPIMSCFGFELFIAKWGYGEWTFPPWNYVYENLVLKKSAAYSNLPWWYFFKLSFSRLIPPISLFIILTTIFYWIKNPKSLVTWSTLPLLIIHSLIPNKEIRFLIPIAPFLALIIPFAFSQIVEFNNKVSLFIQRKGFIRFLKFTMILNLIILFFLTFKSANSMVNLLAFIYSNNEQVKEVIVYGSNPFRPIPEQMTFFKHKDLNYKKVEKFDELFSTSSVPFKIVDRVKWVLKAKEKGCHILYSTFPNFIFSMDLAEKLGKRRAWSLLECK